MSVFYFHARDVTIRFITCLQIFFLQGRLIFGPDVRSLGLTIFLIVAPVTVFCVFVARKLMDDYPHHLGISIMVVAVVFTFYVSSPFLSLAVRDFIFFSYIFLFQFWLVKVASTMAYYLVLLMKAYLVHGFLIGYEQLTETRSCQKCFNPCKRTLQLHFKCAISGPDVRSLVGTH